MQFLISRTGRPFPVYRASSSWVPGENFSELAVLKAGSKRVHVTRIWVSVSQSANGLVVFRIYRKTADNVGGTSSNVVPCKHEYSDASPTAIMRTYTAHPDSVGAEDGAIRTTPLLISGGGIQTGPVEWVFAPTSPEGIVLAPGEMLGLRAGNMDPTGTFYCTIEWCENPDV